MSHTQIKIEQNGLACTLTYTDQNTGAVSNAKASLMFLRKGSDAQLDIIGDELPNWMTVGQRVTINIVWPSKGLVVLAGIISHTIGTSIRVGSVVYQEVIQRRRDAKVSFDVPADVKSNNPGDAGSGTEENTVQVQIVNISAGGVGFKTPYDTFTHVMLGPGKKIAITFEIEPGTTIAMAATVVRAEEKNDGYLHCGASFDRVRAGIEQKIRQKVFKQQKTDNEMERAIKESGLIQIDAFIK